jgi:hypothetical protein
MIDQSKVDAARKRLDAMDKIDGFPFVKTERSEVNNSHYSKHALDIIYEKASLQYPAGRQ